MAGSVIGAVGSIAGGLLGSKSASKQSSAINNAAAQSSEASKYAADIQKEMFDKQVQLQEPFRQSGLAANNVLSMYMGLDPYQQTYEQIKAELLPYYSTSPPNGMEPASGSIAAKFRNMARVMSGSVGRGQSTDWNALEAAIHARLADQSRQSGTSRNDPRYGMLLDTFGNDDFVKDPGYDWRLNEGYNALNSSAAARGGLQSGAALKAATRYGQDYASNEYTNAYNRWNNDRAGIYNKLAGMSGAGQTSANTIGQAAGQYGNSVGNLAMNNAATQGNAAMANANVQSSMYGNWANALSGVGNSLSNMKWGSSGGGWGGGSTPYSWAPGAENYTFGTGYNFTY
jgi:hypothetical protein